MEKEKAWRKAQWEPAPLEQLTPAERCRREQIGKNEQRRQGIFFAPAVPLESPTPEKRAPDIEPKQEPVKEPEPEPVLEPEPEPEAQAMSEPTPGKQAAVPAEPTPAAEMPPLPQGASPPAPGSGAVSTDKLKMQKPHDVPVPAPKRPRPESGKVPFSYSTWKW